MLDPLITSSLVGGASGLLSSVAGGVIQHLENQNQRAFESSLQQKSQHFSAQQSDLANRYNSAGSQVQRLIAAGLSPSAAAQSVAGANSQSAVVPQTIPQSSALKGSISDKVSNGILSAGSSISNALLQRQQIEQQKKQAELLDVQIENARKEENRRQTEFDDSQYTTKRERKAHEIAISGVNLIQDLVLSGDIPEESLRNEQSLRKALENNSAWKDSSFYTEYKNGELSSIIWANTMATLNKNSEYRKQAADADLAEENVLMQKFQNSLQDLMKQGKEAEVKIAQANAQLAKLSVDEYPTLSKLKINNLRLLNNKTSEELQEWIDNKDNRKALFGYELKQEEAKAALSEFDKLKTTSISPELSAILDIAQPVLEMLTGGVGKLLFGKKKK